MNGKKIKAFFRGINKSFLFSIKHNKRNFLINSLCILLITLFQFVFLFNWKYILDYVLSSGSDFEIGFEIVVFVLVFVISHVVLLVLNYLQSNSYQKSKVIVDNKVKEMIIDKLSLLDIAKLDDPKHRDAISVLNSVPNYNDVAVNVIKFFSSLIVLFLTVFMLWIKYPIASLVIVLLYIPLIIILSKNAINAYSMFVNQAEDRRKRAYYRDILTSKEYAKELRLYSFKKYILGIYNSVWDNLTKKIMKMKVKQSVSTFFGELIGSVGVFILIYFILMDLISDSITIGEVSLYLGLGLTLMNSIKEIGWTYASIHNDNYQCQENLDKFLMIEVGKTESEHELSNIPNIVFKDVWFKYPGNKEYTLKGVNFSFSPKEKISLVGINGAGKSTIVKLLLGMYEPTKGQVLVNAKELKSYKSNQYLRYFSVAFQDVELYSRSLEENIKISNFDNNDLNQYKKAILMSGLESKINSLESKDSSEVTRKFDSNGFVPSGGERQMLGLARAYFRNSEILILDEPTANLDAEKEDYMFNQFINDFEDKGAILISHRLSSTLMTDKIILLDDGVITEEGTHVELMKLDGKYCHLFNLQSEKYINGGE